MRLVDVGGRFSIAFAAALVAAGLPGSARAELTFFSTRGTFDLAAPGLQVEGFEAGRVGPGGFLPLTGPLSSASSNAAFQPGEILPGLTVSDIPGPDANGLVFLGEGTTTGMSKNVGAGLFTDGLKLGFGAGINAVGFDLAGALGPGAPVPATFDVQVFDTLGGLLGTTAVATGGIGFLGVISDAAAIGSLTIRSSAGLAEFVDNVAFGSTAQSLVVYSSRAAFDVANPGLLVEDFEEGRVGPGGFQLLSGPLSSTSNNGVFQPGEILPGLTVSDIPGPDANGLVFLGEGTTLGASKTVGSTLFADGLELDFGAGSKAVGFDLSAATGPGLPAAATFDVEVFGTAGLLETVVVNSTGIAFLGLESRTDPITRVVIRARGNFSEFADNVAFAAVPEPSAWASAALGALGLLGAGLRRRARRTEPAGV